MVRLGFFLTLMPRMREDLSRDSNPPRSVELHQTGTFEGRSTDWATAALKESLTWRKQRYFWKNKNEIVSAKNVLRRRNASRCVSAQNSKFKLVNSNSTQTMRAADTLLNFQEKKIWFRGKKSLVVILFFSRNNWIQAGQKCWSWTTAGKRGACWAGMTSSLK